MRGAAGASCLSGSKLFLEILWEVLNESSKLMKLLKWFIGKTENERSIMNEKL